MELAERVAIVTGGAAGIGQSIATVLAENGATVAVADVREEEAVETARELEAKGFSAKAFKVDVSDAAQVQRAGSCRRGKDLYRKEDGEEPTASRVGEPSAFRTAAPRWLSICMVKPTTAPSSIMHLGQKLAHSGSGFSSS